MLESMRNHAQGWIAKIILGGIALSFVLWGVGDYFMGGGAEPVASVNEKPIGQNEFYVEYNRQLEAYRRMLGNQFSKELAESLNLKETTIQTMINRRLMVDTASKLGLVAPEAIVLATIQNEPSFQSAGSFDPQRYQILTRNMGYGSAQDFENEMRINIMVDALQQALTQSVHISEADIRDAFNSEYEQRVLAAIIVDPDTLLSSVKVEEADAKAWYEAHKEAYMSPVRVRLDAVEINPIDLAADISVSEAELQSAYEERKAEYTEEESRKASHILAKVAGDASEAVRLAAREKIEKALARIKAGESFAAVAEDVSEDVTASSGGDLGWFKAGVMTAAFDEAAFSLDKGDLSEIVESEFGFHLIMLEDVRPAAVKSFEEVKETLRMQLLQARVMDEAYKLSQDLDEALGMEDSLKAAAESVNLKVTSIDPVSMDEAIAQPLLFDSEVRAKVFATMPGQAVEIIEAGKGRYVAFEVLERIDPEVIDFAKVASRAFEDARQDEAHKQAKKLADEIRGISDKSLDDLAQQYGQAKYISKPVRSNGDGDNAAGWLTPELLSKAFLTASGSWVDDSLSVSQGIAVVRVEQVIAPDETEYEAKRESIAKTVRQAEGQARFARWMASVRDRAEIMVDEKVLDRF
ncbi:peptidyl-prolyl cis-trans isomerase D [Mariprofundus ferrinatatus]|uniref:Periplasmic chaperone PpiD n=1 Tax=Mariprofundus ferrinatatus TaxID=1921087 RepID=A0A2K8L587_9PROT|nr:SurA N-terminal domain-containing protein [Mariprofundus ferrinatatus]ATX82470.1 peptidyl-prolyl cis-trans isomerase D [Mariprofundus ferrinatatus]